MHRTGSPGPRATEPIQPSKQTTRVISGHPGVNRYGHHRLAQRKIGKPSPQRQGGFTLIEILTVLVIAGLLISLAAPAMNKTLKTYERQSIRTSVSAQIIELPYRSWVEGKSARLGGQGQDVVEVPLPKGWSLHIPTPIHYAFNGICQGGTLTLKDPEGWAESYRLDPPRCDRLLPDQP